MCITSLVILLGFLNKFGTKDKLGTKTYPLLATNI